MAGRSKAVGKRCPITERSKRANRPLCGQVTKRRTKVDLGRPYSISPMGRSERSAPTERILARRRVSRPAYLARLARALAAGAPVKRARLYAILNSRGLPIVSTLAVLHRQEEFTMRIAIGIIAVAAMVVGCTASSSNGPEQSMQPAAGGPGLTYPAHNMAEFDTAMNNADDHCYKEENLARAHYVDRDFETAHFECSPR